MSGLIQTLSRGSKIRNQDGPLECKNDPVASFAWSALELRYATQRLPVAPLFHFELEPNSTSALKGLDGVTMAVGTPDSPERSVMEPFSGKAMKSQFGLDAGMVERLRSVAHSGVALSLLAFFVSVILLGGEIGDPTFAEDLASISSLAIALNGFSYISLGLSSARIARHDGEARRSAPNSARP